MDYGDSSAIERLTGRAFFTPAGDLGMIDLGNVQMLKLEGGLKRKAHLTSFRGRVYADRENVTTTQPVFLITTDEWTTPLLPLIFSGPDALDVTQGELTGQTLVRTVLPGRAYKLGAVGLYGVSIIQPTGLNPGTDYIADPFKGLVYIPAGSSIDPGTVVTFRFSQMQVKLNQVDAFTQLRSSGAMTVYEEGEYDNSPRRTFDFPCSLSIDGAIESKPDDYKKVVFRAAALGRIAVRSATAATSVVAPDYSNILTLDDGTPVTLDDGSYVDIT